MRGKDYNAGLRGVLFEARHYQRMGAAVWLYGWLVLRQTHQQGSVGWVLGGAPISYREIEEETGFNCRTLERWMQTLRQHGYIETEAAPAGVIVRITKAKKYPQAGRRFAEGVRRFAGGGTQECPKKVRKLFLNDGRTDGIGSSSIAGSQERATSSESYPDFHSQDQNQRIDEQNHNSKAPGLGLTQKPGPDRDSNVQAAPPLHPEQRFVFDLRMRQQLLRAEREEAVRRELAVGSGPEVRRS